jgi:hypothetical protein
MLSRLFRTVHKATKNTKAAMARREIMVRQAHHENPEPAEGDILSLPRGDRFTMIFFVFFVAWLLCVTSSGHGGCHPGICYFSLE